MKNYNHKAIKKKSFRKRPFIKQRMLRAISNHSFELYFMIEVHKTIRPLEYSQTNNISNLRINYESDSRMPLRLLLRLIPWK